MAAAQARAAMAADGVDFVDENDARGILLALLKQIAHAAGADAHEHLHEVRSGNGEERHVSLASDRAGQQGLARARGAHQQHTLRNAASELLELLRVLKEVDNLLQLFFRLVDTGHVLECGLLLLRGQQPRPRLAEAERFISASLHLPHHEDPEADQQEQWSGIE